MINDMSSSGKWRWWCQVFVSEHGEGGGNGTDDPESTNQIFEYVLEDDIMHGKEEDGERTGEGKGPGSPGRDEAQPTKHVADEHGAEQVTDDVDERLALISRPGDEVECDAQRREDDAGRKAHALECESAGHRCLF